MYWREYGHYHGLPERDPDFELVGVTSSTHPYYVKTRVWFKENMQIIVNYTKAEHRYHSMQVIHLLGHIPYGIDHDEWNEAIAEAALLA